jgi:hypothetical protein
MGVTCNRDGTRFTIDVRRPKVVVCRLILSLHYALIKVGLTASRAGGIFIL